jgi:hypothetical protein
MSFIGVLETVGKDFAKGLAFAVKYALPAERLAGLLFPSTAPAVEALVDVTTLIQNAVLAIEQKYAASGAQAGTGPQKLADVLLIAGNAVVTLLDKAGISSSADYVEKLVSAVVAVLNVQPAINAAQ